MIEKNPTVGIGFTVLNNFKGAIEAIESVKTNWPYRIYISDQWRNKVPLAARWNEQIRAAMADGCEFALINNDDILFSPETIDAMVDEYIKLNAAGEKVAMVTPLNILGELSSNPYEILGYKRDPANAPTFSEHPNFSSFLVHKSFFDIIGTFDENFDPAWYEDNDMHRRINLLGYKAITTTAAPMVHFGGVTTFMLEIADSTMSRAYYIRKWGGIPESHPGNAIKESFLTPYDDPALTPKDWIPGR